MNNPAPFELTPPPNGEELPGGDRLTQWHELQGKTIAAAIEYPAGTHGRDADAVLVFTDHTWVALAALPDGPDNAALNLWPRYSGSRHPTLVELLHPSELRAAGLINDAVFEHLSERYDAAERAGKAAEAARLRAAAEKLEREL